MFFNRLAASGGLAFAVLIVVTNLILVPAGFPSPGSDTGEAVEFFAAESVIGVAGLFLPVAWFGVTLFASGVLVAVRRSGPAAVGWALTGVAGILVQNVTFAGVVAVRIAVATALGSGVATAGMVWRFHDALFTVYGTFLAMALIGLSIGGWIGRLVPSALAVLGFVAALPLLVSACLAYYVVQPGGLLGLLGLVGWLLWVAWITAYAVCLMRSRSIEPLRERGHDCSDPPRVVPWRF